MRSNPINTSQIAPILAIVVMVPASALVCSRIINSETSALGSAILVAGLVASFLALVKPKAGLYAAIVFALYTDFLKKLAVYYGVVSTYTISEVMVVVFTCVGCVYLGIMFGAAMGRLKVTVMDLILYAASVLLMGLFFLTSYKDNGFAGSLQLAAQIGFYGGLVPSLRILLPDRDSLLRLLRFIYWAMLPWSVYGIWQYFAGFSQLEWFYAETGLSPVSSAHMFSYEEPRPFGFGSGSMSYGAILVPACFGIWQFLFFRKNRMLYIIGTVVYLAGIAASLQRVVIVLPLVILFFYFFSRRGKSLVVAYSIPLILFILGVAYSTTILDNMGNINATIQSENKWASKFFDIGTFTPRLEGWALLTDAKFYTFFGTLGQLALNSQAQIQEFDSHDFVTKIINFSGVVGLAICILMVTFFLYSLHRLSLRIPPGMEKSLAVTLTSIFVCYAGISVITGGNFNTNPYNFLMWVCLGGAYMLSDKYGLSRRVAQKKTISEAEQSITAMAIPAGPHRPKFSRNL